MFFTLVVYAEADVRLLRHALDSSSKGIVMNGVGAGNVNSDQFSIIKHIASKEITVVLASRIYRENAQPIFGGSGGSKIPLNADAILAVSLPAAHGHLLPLIGILLHGQDRKALARLFSF